MCVRSNSSTCIEKYVNTIRSRTINFRQGNKFLLKYGRECWRKLKWRDANEHNAWQYDITM